MPAPAREITDRNTSGTLSELGMHICTLRASMPVKTPAHHSTFVPLPPQKLRDIDATTARPKLPSRALPDDIRAKLKLPGAGAGWAAAAPPRKAGNIVAVTRMPKAQSKGNLRGTGAGAKATGGQRKPFDASPYTQCNSMQKI